MGAGNLDTPEIRDGCFFSVSLHMIVLSAGTSRRYHQDLHVLLPYSRVVCDVRILNGKHMRLSYKSLEMVSKMVIWKKLQKTSCVQKVNQKVRLA